MQEFYYRSGHPALGHFPGHHRSRLGDSGQEFRSHVPITHANDARRLDLLASLRDPLGQWLVRLASERKAIPVYAVADLSASMAYVGRRRRLDVLADFTESLAWSAWRTGDPFGFVGCDERVRPEWVQPPARSRGTGSELARRLRGFAPSGRGAAGLGEAHRMLRRQRSLVFLLSDFHLPLAELDRVLDSLAMHELVPVLLWDRAELEPPPERFGLLTLRDAESGRRRLLWLRPALRERWRSRLEARQDELAALFHRHRLRPLWLLDGFDAEAVTAYFHR
ncbi:MAG TPA: MxaS protein [Methylibium sp.]|nr:MxaS protein [Methylibium sp.]